MKKFNAKRLELLRRERRLTQDELARELGISRVTVNYWENEKRTPNVYEISKLSKYFNVSEEQLIYDSKSNEAIVRKNVQLALKDLEKDIKWLSEKIKLPASLIESWLNGKQAFSRLQIDRIIGILKEAGINIIEAFESVYSMPITSKVLSIPLMNTPVGRKRDFFQFSEGDYSNLEELPISLYPDANFVMRFESDIMQPEIPKNAHCVIKRMIAPLNNVNMLVKTDYGYTIAKVTVKKGKEIFASHIDGREEFIKTSKIEIIGKVRGIYTK